MTLDLRGNPLQSLPKEYFDLPFTNSLDYVARGGKDIGYFSNLAMGYLYNGQYEEAYAIYAQYKRGVGDDNRTGKEVFLQDLKEVPCCQFLRTGRIGSAAFRFLKTKYCIFLSCQIRAFDTTKY